MSSVVVSWDPGEVGWFRVLITGPLLGNNGTFLVAAGVTVGGGGGGVVVVGGGGGGVLVGGGGGGMSASSGGAVLGLPRGDLATCFISVLLVLGDGYL